MLNEYDTGRMEILVEHCLHNVFISQEHWLHNSQVIVQNHEHLKLPSGDHLKSNLKIYGTTRNYMQQWPNNNYLQGIM